MTCGGRSRALSRSAPFRRRRRAWRSRACGSRRHARKDTHTRAHKDARTRTRTRTGGRRSAVSRTATATKAGLTAPWRATAMAATVSAGEYGAAEAIRQPKAMEMNLTRAGAAAAVLGV
eukprot:2131912-Pleurochrysis_carterae.AAC.1